MKRLLRIAAVLIGLLLVAAIALPFLIDANRFRPMLEAELSRALAREVHIGDLKVSLWSGGATASDISIADDPRFQKAPFVKAASLSIGVKWMPLLFSHALDITGITVNQPEIVLLENAAGDWNYASLGTQAAAKPATPAAKQEQPLALSVSKVKIRDGRVTMGNTGGRAKPTVVDKLDVELTDFSAKAAFPFQVAARVDGSGQIQLKGQLGPINSDDATATPVNVTITGSNLRSADVQGVFALEATANSNGRRVQTAGKVKAEKLKLAKDAPPSPQPLEFDFRVGHDLKKHAGTLSGGRILVGKAQAALAGSYEMKGDDTLLNFRLTGQKMPVPELAAMLPSLGVVLPAGSALDGGTAHVDLTMVGKPAALVTTGSFGVDGTTLKGFDLGSKVKLVAALAGIKTGKDTLVEKFATNAKVTPEGTAIDGFTLVSPGIGELTGAGNMNAGHALDFKMQAHLATGGTVMAALGQQQGGTNIPFFIRGTADNPQFVPDVRSIATSQAKTLLGGKNPVEAATGLFKGLFGKKKTEEKK